MHEDRYGRSKDEYGMHDMRICMNGDKVVTFRRKL